MAAISRDEILSRLKLDRRELLVPAIEVWCQDSTAVLATVQVQGETLICSWGEEPPLDYFQLPLPDYADMEELADGIRTEGTGTTTPPPPAPSWNTIVRLGSLAPSDLYAADKEALGYGGRALLYAFDLARLDRLLEEAVALMEEKAHRNITQRTKQYVCSGNGDIYLYLPDYPVADVTVTVDGDVLDEDEYDVVAEKGILLREGGWSLGWRNVIVECTVGWDDGDLPPLLRSLILDVVEWLYHVQGRDPTLHSERTGSLTRVRVAGMPSDIEDKLALFRRF